MTEQGKVAPEQEGVEGILESLLCAGCQYAKFNTGIECAKGRENCGHWEVGIRTINQLLTLRIADAVKARDKYLMQELKARNISQMFINVFKGIIQQGRVG